MVATRVQEGKTDWFEGYLFGYGSALRVGLFTAPSSPSGSTALAGVTAATFTGYAAQTPTFGSLSIDGNGNATATAGAVTFTCSGSGSPQTILGWYLYNNSTNRLVDIELFSAPVVISTSGQFITVTPTTYQTEGKTPL